MVRKVLRLTTKMSLACRLKCWVWMKGRSVTSDTAVSLALFDTRTPNFELYRERTIKLSGSNIGISISSTQNPIFKIGATIMSVKQHVNIAYGDTQLLADRLAQLFGDNEYKITVSTQPLLLKPSRS